MKLYPLTKRLTFFPLSLLFGTFLLLPILFFLWPMLSSGTSTLLAGDFDMQVQMTEAARTSLLYFHEFPWWNPWVSGGVPLYADPQFGLITPQTFLSLPFGAIMGWKLTILLYYSVGFFSMLKLLVYLSRPVSIAQRLSVLFLSYIWIFNSFFALRSIGGHFTFILLTLLPLAIYILIRLGESKRYFVYMTALISYMLNAAVHYSVIQTMIVLSMLAFFLFAFDFWQRKPRISIRTVVTDLHKIASFRRIVWLVAAFFASFIIMSPRLALTFQYLHANGPNRSGQLEPYIGMTSGLASLALPYQDLANKYSDNFIYGAFEASAYIGGLTIVLFIALTLFIMWQVKRHRKLPKHVNIIVTFCLFGMTVFIFGLGGKVFNYSRDIPILSSMRVSTRYFLLTALAVVIIISIYIRVCSSYHFRHSASVGIMLAILLGISSVSVAVPSRAVIRATWHGNPLTISLKPPNKNTYSSHPLSLNMWHHDSRHHHYDALTDATRNNISQNIADNALVNSYTFASKQCDERYSPCTFVQSNNAVVKRWTPNSIVLQRTARGLITLNLNSSSYYLINGIRQKNIRPSEPLKQLVVTDPSEIISIKVVPSLTETLPKRAN